MSRMMMGVAVIGTAVAAIAFAGLASAQQQPQQGAGKVQDTPKGFNYVIKDGKPVPKGQRVTNPDGSWREETKVGSCVTVKEGSPDGSVKITRSC